MMVTDRRGAGSERHQLRRVDVAENVTRTCKNTLFGIHCGQNQPDIQASLPGNWDAVHSSFQQKRSSGSTLQKEPKFAGLPRAQREVMPELSESGSELTKMLEDHVASGYRVVDTTDQRRVS